VPPGDCRVIEDKVGARVATDHDERAVELADAPAARRVPHEERHGANIAPGRLALPRSLGIRRAREGDMANGKNVTAEDAAIGMWIQDRRERFVLRGGVLDIEETFVAAQDPPLDMERVAGPDEPERARLRRRRETRF
jgi:hypothetical protein